MPGDLVVVRNIANIVPPYRKSEEFLATTSAIEYAIQTLNVKNVIVCGHSNCGGCAALWQDEAKFQKTPNVRRWLDLMSSVKMQVQAVFGDNLAKREWLTERLNLINCYSNLLTYPGVNERLKDGDVKIYVWHYIIETGEIYNYDFSSNTFKLLGVEK